MSIETILLVLVSVLLLAVIWLLIVDRNRLSDRICEVESDCAEMGSR